MKHNRLIASALIGTGFVAAAGCTTSDRSSSADGVALTTLGPVERPAPSPHGGFHLGAGDNLGQDVFENYVELVSSRR